MAMNLDANYTLTNNLDLTAELANLSSMWGTASASVPTGITTGFVPIGSTATPFKGTFDGRNQTITGLAINRPTTDEVGLFGNAYYTAKISNIGLLNNNIVGHSYVGGLVGFNGNDGISRFNASTVSNVYATGSVTGSDLYTGGLVGFNGGIIKDSYAADSVTGVHGVGGLVGGNLGFVSNSHYDIENVTINGGQFVTTGGLYSTQYQDWIKHNKTLNIANAPYVSTLPLDLPATILWAVCKA
jgi:hypothetical protein